MRSWVPDGYKSRGEGTPYNALYGEAPPELGTFFSMRKGRDYTSWGIWKGRGICYFGRQKAEKG